MADVAGLCNSALSKIGATHITSLEEGSKNANLCASFYTRCRDDLLRAHSWNFATARARLARLSLAPIFGYSVAYALPADWLRWIAAYAEEAGARVLEFKIEGNALLCDADRVYLRCVRRIEDVNLMPADFREALASLLARELAVPIAHSNSLEEKLDARFRSRLRRARTTDGLEDRADPLPQGAWVAVR